MRRDKCPSFHNAARTDLEGEFQPAGRDGHRARSAQARRRNSVDTPPKRKSVAGGAHPHTTRQHTDWHVLSGMQQVCIPEGTNKHMVHPNHAIEPLQHACKRRLEVRGRVQNSLRATYRRVQPTWSGDREYLFRVVRQRALPAALQKIQAVVKSSLTQLGHARFLIGDHTRHLLDLRLAARKSLTTRNPPL